MGPSTSRSQNPRDAATASSLGLSVLPRSDRLFVQAADQLQATIIDELHAGDRLPAERHLAASLGVSRTVVREAVRVLEARGLLAPAPNGGMVVRALGPDSISDSLVLLMRARRVPASFEDMHEIRTLLEVPAAGAAATHRGTQHLADMERALARMTAESRHFERGGDAARRDFAAADEEFHNHVAAATGNPLLHALLESVAEMAFELRLQTSRSSGAPEDALTFHGQILDAIRHRDAPRAEEAMRQHLLRADEYRRERTTSDIAGTEQPGEQVRLP